MSSTSSPNYVLEVWWGTTMDRRRRRRGQGGTGHRHQTHPVPKDGSWARKEEETNNVHILLEEGTERGRSRQRAHNFRRGCGNRGMVKGNGGPSEKLARAG